MFPVQRTVRFLRGMAGLANAPLRVQSGMRQSMRYTAAWLN